MDLAADTSWLAAGHVAAVALALMAAPGWVIARAAGLAALDRLALAMPLGVTALVVAGWAADLAGVAWTRGSSVLSIVVVTAVLAAGARAVRPVHGDEPPTVSWAGVCAGVGIVLVGTLWKVVDGIPRPGSLSHEPDAQFHLLAITHLLDLQSASPVRSGEVYYYGPSFYPGGFHSIASTVATWSGSGAVVAAHVVLVVAACLAWPIGVVVLVARAVSPSGWVLAAAGALALTAVLAPISMLSIGAPWANMLSASLVPGTLVPLALLASRTLAPGLRTTVSAALLVVVASAGATLAQPNGAYSIALLSAAMLGPVAFRWGRAWIVAYVVGLAAVVLCWTVPVSPVMLDIAISIDSSDRRAVLVLLKNGNVPLWSGVVVALLTLVGVAVGIRRGRLAAGLALMWVVTAGLALSLQLGDVLPVARLTWPWFSGYARIATLVSVTVVLVASITVASLLELVGRRSTGLVPAVGAVAVAVLALAAVPATSAGEDILQASYDPTSPRGFITPAEAADLRELARDLEPEDTVAADPARGGVFIGLYGPRVVPVGPFYAWTTDIELVATRLDEAATDAEVCAAARRLGVTHVLTGGTRADTFTEIPAYPGIDAVQGASGFRLAASAGDYRLFEVPRACRPTVTSR